MSTMDTLLLPKHFDSFLPGFHGIEFFSIIMVAAIILSRHPSLETIPAIIGGLIGFFILPRLFMQLAKHGLLGANWDKDGLTNNPYR